MLDALARMTQSARLTTYHAQEAARQADIAQREAKLSVWHTQEAVKKCEQYGREN